MTISAPVLGIGGAIARAIFGFPGGLGRAIIAAIIGGVLGFMMGSIPAFGAISSIGVGVPGVILVPGVAGLAGSIVANSLF